MGKKNWVAGAIKHPGSLRQTAMGHHLIAKGQKLSAGDLNKLSAMGGTTAKRANLAKTLRSFRHK